MGISITPCTWKEHQEQLKNIRTRVFVEEQKVPAELEWDDADNLSTHFLAVDDNDNGLGCIRLTPSGQLSRLCVLENARNQGIGSQLLKTAEAHAQQVGMKEVFLHAQTHATSFYEAAGFSVNGGIFVEADIPHRQMFKELT